MPNYVLNNTAFYNAPKNAGTTIRMWIKYNEDQNALGDLQQLKGYYNLAPFGAPKGWIRNIVGPNRFFQRRDDVNLRWCVKRDPLARFVSAYRDKILNEKIANWTVDETIELLENGRMQKIAESDANLNLLAAHFVPQYVWLGTDTAYYSHVFDITEMAAVKEFCEKVVFNRPLPDLHARDQSKSKTQSVTLPDEQIVRIRKVFAKDYEVGWA
ncbi:MAG: sulfotransferase family 2 domain-containing protein [Pseudomonadota bacterium]